MSTHIFHVCLSEAKLIGPNQFVYPTGFPQLFSFFFHSLTNSEA